MLKVADYIGLIDPCLARVMTIQSSPDTLALIKDAVAQGKVVAVQTGGVSYLFLTGVLKGKQYANIKDVSANYPDSIFKGDGVVQDGKIITGGVCPELAKLMLYTKFSAYG